MSSSHEPVRGEGGPVSGASASAGAPRSSSTPLLEMRGIVKRFPGVLALGGVDLDVRAGEVHCLLGQNGAGKSTLIKVLSASYQPDEGEILWEDRPVTLTTTQSAMKLGISTIYQELDLVPGLTVAENIFLGHELSSAGMIQRGQTNRAAADLLARLGHGEIPATREVGRLTPAAQQIVSMARALSQDTRLLILDEPSAVLDQGEVDNLFRVIRDLTAEGVAVVYISHRLEEIRQIGDRITVLKDGSTVASGLAVADTPTADLIKLMTGRSIEYVFPPRSGTAPVSGQPVLEVSGLELPGVFSGVDLSVHAGEIVGLAGLVGAGRSEILETVYGARRPSAGTVRVNGRELRRGSVPAAVKAGLGLAPEERKSQGLLLDQAVYSNITISTLGRFARLSFLDSGEERRRAKEVTESLDVRPAGVDRLVRLLSGGNQQKVVLARWLLRECQVLLLDEPTRGVDVGARAEIYAVVRALADSGVAVVVVSSEVEEVLGLADRVLVVREGRVVHEGPSSEIDESRVLDLVMKGTAA
ncbi:sugar ABC transporter ATP-binding protein [Nocardioides renjunii]|uniref:sugar ABC transporter ATP-binding protein n=1 Tax=Nocardioides renjunii TaxID=3095075 RepID=UPI002AFFCB7E|nr:sugar ABC transporter ATP-binding protein [Nocardioides sp. S-34]WQQ23461.1 sugar ABC transporter ATP-binding protein [Nocardioides sp. S-34]